MLVGACLAGAAALVLIAVMVVGPALSGPPEDGAKPSTQEAVEATFVGSQIKEIDKAHSSLVLSYDVKNNSDIDYRLSEGSGVLILSHLKSDGSLSQEQPFRLSYPLFVPAKQRAHLAIEIVQPFAWPADNDPALLSKLQGFVRQRLANVEEFVVFDVSKHQQLRLPSAWQQLQDGFGQTSKFSR